jgi:hypothetical protein
MPRSRFTLRWSVYRQQRARWPQTGRHILAQHSDDHVVVYQAYSAQIAAWAVEHQCFGGPWSFDRMSWIKPNFLWMMYRCGWASKPNQERVLAITLQRAGFDAILSLAVESSHYPDIHGPDRDAWRKRGKLADVRMQWDPDHAPGGGKLSRRAIQLGLRGETLRRYATEWAVRIDDITHEVHTQAENRGDDRALKTPWEALYTPADAAVRKRIRLDKPR